MVDLDKARREGMRWNILNTLHKTAPHTASELFVIDVMRGIYSNVTTEELRRQLDYLEARNLVELRREPSGIWYADLGRYGFDIVEYTVACEPGIARPERFGTV